MVSGLSTNLLAQTTLPAGQEAPPARSWTINFAKDVFLPAHRDESLRYDLSFTGPALSAPAIVRYAVEQLIRGDSLIPDPKTQWRSENYEMKPVARGETKLTFRTDNTAVFSLPLADQPFGVHYLKLEVLDDRGAVVLTREDSYNIVVTVTANQPGNISGPDSWGWTCGWYGVGAPQNTAGPADEAYFQRYGFAWAHVRVTDFLWDRFQGQELEDRLKLLDRYVEIARQNNAKIVLCFLDGIPGDFTLERFRPFADMIIKRYAKDVAAWEAWNEPDSKPYAMENDRDIEVIKILHELKQKYCPDTHVITSTHMSSGMNYLVRILEKGAGRYMEGMGLHQYRSMPPDVPESDGYTGNPSGMATLADAIEQARALLVKYDVKPGRVYLTEGTYALNLTPQYDDNDQANFMIRCNIIARTKPYVPCFIHHAFGNGRLERSTYPNMITHTMDTTFEKQIVGAGPEINGYLFRKSDGRIILPVWAMSTDKIIRITALKAKPDITDIYGNELPIVYREESGTADFIRLSQACTYLTFSKDSTPAVDVPKRLIAQAPAKAERPSTQALAVSVKELPTGAADLHVTFPKEFNLEPIVQPVDQPKDLTFPVQLPVELDAGTYTIQAELVDKNSQTVALDHAALQVVLPATAMNKKLAVIFSDDFESGKLAEWTSQQNSQHENSLVDDGGQKVLQITQKGIDYGATLEHALPAVPYGALEFRFKPSAVPQTFNVRLGAMTIVYDGAGQLGVLGAKGDFAKAGPCQPNAWHWIRAVFDAPEGLCHLWIDQASLGSVTVPAAAGGYDSLRLMAGVKQTPGPAVFLFDDVRVTQIAPQEFGKHRPLRWTMCGPFPNYVDPKTMKRDFEKNVDYLKSVGGQDTLIPYPGLTVPYGDQTRMFHALYESQPRDDWNYSDYVAFCTVKDLGLVPDQGDIICYAACYLYCPGEQKVAIGIGSDDSNRVWVNQKEVGWASAWPSGRSVSPDNERYAAVLGKGLNVILVEIDQGFGAYDFCLRITPKPEGGK